MRPTLSIVHLVLALAAVVVPCNAQTEFEIRNQMGRRANPSGLKLELRTSSGRSTFHLYETIPIEWVFSNAGPSLYAIELDEEFNVGGQTNKFEVSDTDSIIAARPQFGNYSFACCNSHKRHLSVQGTTLRRELTDFLRFENAGTYSVYLVTNRVFTSPGKQSYYRGSDLTLTSNILTVTILPDYPDWDSSQLSTALRELRDPQVNANYLTAVKHARNLPRETDQSVAMLNAVQQADLVKAQKALNALDTDEAIRRRVEMMGLATKEDLKFGERFTTESTIAQPQLASTTRSEFLEATMRQRASRPSFGVDYDFTYWWSRFLVQRKHPEVLRFLTDGAERQTNAKNYGVYYREAELEILALLESIVQDKQAEAQTNTILTIKILKSFTDTPRPAPIPE